jgi:hypothetical protein
LFSETLRKTGAPRERSTQKRTADDSCAIRAVHAQLT